MHSKVIPKKIDKVLIHQYLSLNYSDQCYYWREYNPNQPHEESDDTYSFIHNLKKCPTRKGKDEYKYKEKAIQDTIEFFRSSFNSNALHQRITLVPIPPSKIKGDEKYDDRMTQICKGLCENTKWDCRELIKSRKSIQPSHYSSERLKPKDLKNIFEIDSQLINPIPSKIYLFDDVITTGAHFRACKEILQNHISNVVVIGIFIARVTR
ncbi:MAG: hypothetical protein OXE77_03755 [Flavobacteriaceae bacterium]|nr:hypothetical protein [Flavobacteriaceae bacterium]MCY4267166.1 hypothetical protein [Flavobacteriaceae bacterium]